MHLLPEDRASRPLAATLTCVAGVGLLVVSFVNVLLAAFGRIQPTYEAMIWIGIPGFGGTWLLFRFFHLDWRRDLSVGDLPVPLRGCFQFSAGRGSGTMLQHVGAVEVRADGLVLAYRTWHPWIYVTCYFLDMLSRMVWRAGESGVPFLMVAGLVLPLILALFRGERRIPFAEIHRVSIQGGQLFLYHGYHPRTIGNVLRTTIVMEVRPHRRLRDLLAARFPIEVSPSPPRPGKAGPTGKSPREPAPPRPPRTAIDERKVAELDRAMKGLDRLQGQGGYGTRPRTATVPGGGSGSGTVSP